MAIRGPEASSFFPLTLVFSVGFFCARFFLDRLVYKVKPNQLSDPLPDSCRVPRDLFLHSVSPMLSPGGVTQGAGWQRCSSISLALRAFMAVLVPDQFDPDNSMYRRCACEVLSVPCFFFPK
jgi:hypothetical protein